MVPMRTDPEGLLLLGGSSVRFGREKMNTPLHGAPLYHAAYRAMSGVCRHIHLSLAHPDAAFEEPPDVAGCSWDTIADRYPGQGPLGGIGAALEERDLLVVAGDLPAIQAASLEQILSVSRDSRAWLVAARAGSSGREQPLCGLWRATMREALATYLASGRRSVFGFLDQVPIQWVDIEDGELTNINRPQDLDLLTRMS